MAKQSEQRRVLIVEDNLMIAMDVERMLVECGCCAIGPVPSIAEGLEAVRQMQPDGAILDVNLRDERVWPVAELLDQLGVPFVLTTGYSATEVPDDFKDRPILPKPLTQNALMRALRELRLVPS